MAPPVRVKWVNAGAACMQPLGHGAQHCSKIRLHVAAILQGVGVLFQKTRQVCGCNSRCRSTSESSQYELPLVSDSSTTMAPSGCRPTMAAQSVRGLSRSDCDETPALADVVRGSLLQSVSSAPSTAASCCSAAGMLQPALSNSQMLSSLMSSSLLDPFLRMHGKAAFTAHHRHCRLCSTLRTMMHLFQTWCVHLYPKVATGLLASTNTIMEYFASSAAAASGK